jgi:hypothetical protein
VREAERNETNNLVKYDPRLFTSPSCSSIHPSFLLQATITTRGRTSGGRFIKGIDVDFSAFSDDTAELRLLAAGAKAAAEPARPTRTEERAIFMVKLV